MIAGLPGTGIGGLYYLLLAVCMPICELGRLLRRRTSLRRWCFIALQVGFVAAILGGMWAEMWLLNQALVVLRDRFHVSVALLGVGANGQLTFQQTRWVALAAAGASLVSLALVAVLVHLLRLLVPRKPRRILSIREFTVPAPPLPGRRPPSVRQPAA